MARRSTKRRPRVVGVIASRADLERAVRMRRPPDLFELRLDRLAGMADRSGKDVIEAAHAAHHHSATPAAKVAQQTSLRQRRDLLTSIFKSRRLSRRRITLSPCAAALLAIAENEKRPANHFVPQFQIDTERAIARGQSARGEIACAQIFSRLLRAPTRRWNSDVCSSS